MATKLDLYTADGQRKFLIPEERDRFIKAAATMEKRDERTFCLTLAHTGCRLSEALALPLRRVDLDNGLITIRSLKKRSDTHHRSIPVPPSLLDALDLVHDIRARQRKLATDLDPLLWSWGRTKGWGTIIAAMNSAGLTGPQATPKGLRHGFAVNARHKGIEIDMIQRYLGHTSMETTAIYLEVSGVIEREIASKMWE